MKRKTNSHSSGLATLAVAIVLPLLLSACAANILEQRYVLLYQCEVSPDGTQLALSGTSSGSALLVKKVKKVRKGHDVIVNVHIGLVSRSKSGHFSEKIPIGQDLSRVLFGRERTVVWSRELGGCAPLR